MSIGKVPDGAIVLFDTPAFVYYLERHPGYYSQAAELFERMVDGRLTGCASVVVLTELLVPFYGRSEPVRARGLSSAIRSIPNLRVLDVTTGIAERAAQLRSKHTLRTPDALHFATGLEYGAEWFITNDRRLQRIRGEGIRVVLFTATSG
ncbi:MAG TPA: type II toxin-antitoxin system VapC family toxin [Longimicrobiaceae bacterium]|nr:type II toxin-antitoxin system VapC family toxin [Longimicrobiaceae bacterium]